jgi:hypothetical protein
MKMKISAILLISQLALQTVWSEQRWISGACEQGIALGRSIAESPDECLEICRQDQVQSGHCFRHTKQDYVN